MFKVILVAGDSATMRLTVRLLLEERNPKLAVQEAIDGVDAIEKAEAFRPDLIFLAFPCLGRTGRKQRLPSIKLCQIRRRVRRVSVRRRCHFKV
jgi:DNA-binding response OmpR family regulator